MIVMWMIITITIMITIMIKDLKWVMAPAPQPIVHRSTLELIIAIVIIHKFMNTTATTTIIILIKDLKWVRSRAHVSAAFQSL